MRYALSLAVIVAIATAGTSSAALVEISEDIKATANGWDNRTTGHGCSPNGCIADNVLDNSIEPESRWSCKASVSGLTEACALTLVFDKPQDILEMRLALYKGDERTRLVNVHIDGSIVSTIETSGTTTGYETFELKELQVPAIILESTATEENGWISFTGVKFMTELEIEVSPDGPAPTSDDYVGCYNDLVADRVLASVMIDDDLTPAACAAACTATGDSYYALQQGNECWCAGCELTENETNTDYDRHGEGICSTPCAGDSMFMCGGDLAFSFYQSDGCVAFPAVPTFIPVTLEPSIPPILPSSDRSSSLSVLSASTFTSASSPSTSTATVVQTIDGLPEAITAAIMADAVSGFAGPGSFEVTTQARGSYDYDNAIVIGKDDAGTLTVPGTFMRLDGAALPSSTALFIYLDSDETIANFARGQAELDASTGAFTISVADFPDAFTRVILSFVVLDPAESVGGTESGSVFPLPVVNNGCSDPLTITLEWDTDGTDLDLWVYEPGGEKVSFMNRAGDVGYLNDDNNEGFGPETYVVYGGLGGAVLGEYQAVAVGFQVIAETTWTLTARSDGVVVWIEQGVFVGESSSSSSSTDDSSSITTDDDTTTSRRGLFSFDSEPSYSDDASTVERSDTFTVVLDSFMEVEC